MDKRNRPAQSRKRHGIKGGVVTISLMLTEKTIDELAHKAANSDNKNMSEIIESTVRNYISKNKNIEIPARKPYFSFPVKKTFTFSPDFVKIIKNSKSNMSTYVDTVLQKAFSL